MKFNPDDEEVIKFGDKDEPVTFGKDDTPSGTQAYIDRITGGKEIKPTEGKVKDVTQPVTGVGNRNVADDFAASTRRALARPVAGTIKTLRDDFGFDVKDTEDSLEKWIGDQGPISNLSRGAGGLAGTIPYIAAGLPGILTQAAGNTADTRAGLKRQGASELAASTVGAIEGISTIAGGALLRSTKPLTSALQNVAQEAGTTRAQRYVLDNSMTPELGSQYEITPEQLLFAAVGGAAIPSLNKQLKATKTARYADVEPESVQGVRKSVMDEVEKQLKKAAEQKANTDMGLTPEGNLVIKDPVLNRAQQKVQKAMEVGEPTDGTAEASIDVQRIQAPQFGSKMPRFGQDQEAHGRAQDAAQDAVGIMSTRRQPPSENADLADWLSNLPPEEAARLLKDGPKPDGEAINAYANDLEPVVEHFGKYFDPAQLNAETGPSGYWKDHKNRATITLMPIDDFLLAAEKLKNGPDPMKEKRTAETVGKWTLPYLYVDDNGGKQEVVGHEGRHRAMYLKAHGETHIPVMLKLGGKRWGEMDSFPTKMLNQDQDADVNVPQPLVWKKPGADGEAAETPKGWDKIEGDTPDERAMLEAVLENSRKVFRTALTKDSIYDAIDAVSAMTVRPHFKEILTRATSVLKSLEAQGVKINYEIVDKIVRGDNISARGSALIIPGKEITVKLNKAFHGDASFEVFTHEVVHAVVLPIAQRVAFAINTNDTPFLKANPELVQAHRDLQSLFKQFKDAKDVPFAPAVKNMQEFLAYGMTDEGTISWLKKQKVAGTNGLMAFVRSIGKFLGFKETDVTAHAELWRIFDKLAEKGKGVDMTFNGKRGDKSMLYVMENVYNSEVPTPKGPTGSLLEKIPGLEEASMPSIKNLDSNMRGQVDIKGSALRNNMRPGFRFESWQTKHALIQTAHSEIVKAKARANVFLREHVTGERGKPMAFGQLGSMMNIKQLTEVHTILKAGSKNKVRIDPDVIPQLSDVQKAYIKSLYKAFDARWANGNRAREEAGLPKIPYTSGYYPGILDADYASVGTDKNGVVVNIGGDNTKWGHKKAVDWIKTDPDVVKVTKVRDGSIYGNFNSDLMEGLIKVLKIMPENVEGYDLVKKLKHQVDLMEKDQLFGMHLHRLPKRGITGMTGDRPWLSPEENARDMHKALIMYFSKAVNADELQVPMIKLGDAMDKYRDDHPNAVNAIKEWMDQVKGTTDNQVGKGLNMVIYGIADGLGAGPSKVRGAMGLTADLATQHVLGWYNALFFGTQFLQIPQGGGPFAMFVAERLKMNPVEAAAAWSEGLAKGSLMLGEFLTPGGKFTAPVDNFTRDAHNYAQKMGILQFSEIERLHAESQGKLKQTYDGMAEWTMKMGELGTRPLVFMAMANLIHKSDMGRIYPPEVVLDHAYNVTQLSMADYSPEQRPLIYSKLGILGQGLGKFSTFKHNFVGQEIILGKEAVKGDPMPFLAMNAILMASAGLLGFPFMEDMLDLLKLTTGKNYKEELLKNTPAWAATGVLSEALGVYIQPKLSAGNLVSDSPMDSFPAFSILTRAMMQVLDVGGKAIDGTVTTQDAKNTARALLPSSMQRPFDRQFNRGPDNELIGKEGDTRDVLTDEEWDTRKFFGWQGVKPNEAQRNAVDRESFDTNKRNDQRIKGVEDTLTRMMLQGELTEKIYEKQLEKFIKAGGDPSKLAGVIDSKVSILKQPMWYRRMKKNQDGVLPTPGNARILDNPYRQ